MKIEKKYWSCTAIIVGISFFTAIVTMLHFLQPDYDFRYQLMSELALGNFGWAMFPAFVGLSIAVFGVQSAISSYGAKYGYRCLLTITAIFFLMSGIFPLGESSTIHITSISFAFVLSVLAMYLFPSSSGQASIIFSRMFSWTLAVGVAVSVAIGNTIIPIGISQRMAAACLFFWMITLSWRLFRLNKEE